MDAGAGGVAAHLCFVLTISAPTTSLSGSSGRCVVTQNQRAAFAANRCRFTERPLVEQRGRGQKEHNAGRAETPRERKNRGQRARTHTHTHT